jgi:uncharacterized protein with HEPN domain
VSRQEFERLRDIANAIAAIRDYLAAAEGIPTREVDMLRSALLFQFVVIGEAVKHLTTETREAHPDIPWAAVAGLRDLIAHEYFAVRMERILEIVEHDLPALERNLGEMLEAAEETADRDS